MLVLEALAELAAAGAKGGAGFDDTGRATINILIYSIKVFERCFPHSLEKAGMLHNKIKKAPADPGPTSHHGLCS